MAGETSGIVPIIDFAPFLDPKASEDERKATAKAVTDAARDVGFFMLKGHGVEPSYVAEAFEQVMPSLCRCCLTLTVARRPRRSLRCRPRRRTSWRGRHPRATEATWHRDASA